MATVTYALTSKEKVKSFLGITDSSSDDVIDELISYVTDFIESICGRRFKETTYTDEQYDARGQNDLFLKNYPISTLTTVKYRSGNVSSPTWISFDANDYLLYGESGFIHFMGKLPNYPKYVQVAYVAGYKIDWANELSATHTLPFDVAMVATEMVANLHETRKNQGIQSMSTEGQSVSFVDVQKQITQKQMTALTKYKAYQIR